MVSVNNIVLAILCFLGLGCGLSYIILVTNFMYLFEDRLEYGHSALHAVTPIAWMTGLAGSISFYLTWGFVSIYYIIPGLVGMIACCVRRKRMYIGHMFLALSVLGVLAVLFLKGMTKSGPKTEGPHFCEMTNNHCSCEYEPIIGSDALYLSFETSFNLS